jgi:hypothetical protein
MYCAMNQNNAAARFPIAVSMTNARAVKNEASMKRPLFAALLAVTFAPVIPTSASAALESACLRSDRPQATRSLCRCIGAVANQTLTRSEQRRAASFFRDPQLAQDTRMSRNERDNQFWARYRAFGEAAEQRCSGL